MAHAFHPFRPDCGPQPASAERNVDNGAVHAPRDWDGSEDVVRARRDLCGVARMASLDRVIRRKCGSAERSPPTMATKEGVMRVRCLLVIAAFMALTLGTAQTALADNNATGSVGAVQTGPVGVTPTAGTRQAGAPAAPSLPGSVGGSRHNPP